ncbi:hypothetical protein GGH93_005843 [Coemansia aciculifera]|nr:hypothetical protein GGH93_005843 [Coemansia aciculifera]
MNFIEIGADEDEEFTTGQTGDSIKQQMHHISEAVRRLVVLDDTTDFQMISALYVAPSTSIIQHLELGSSKLYVSGMIRIIAALPTLISLVCEMDEPVLDTMASPESTREMMGLAENTPKRCRNGGSHNSSDVNAGKLGLHSFSKWLKRVEN